MREYLHRCITAEETILDEEGDKLIVSASRLRNSDGREAIELRLGAGRIEIEAGEDTERIARKLIELLTRVCDDPRALPQ